ncbi:MAG: SAF domain-containing protein [Candidatus Obscuribacter sp.]|nr:SAF domain-containing protein [Candidatus Melainabacteria bacterium]MDX1986365.1 SAF domain-containing protein [Candidatus Obscuribacter sp.]
MNPASIKHIVSALILFGSLLGQAGAVLAQPAPSQNDEQVVVVVTRDVSKGTVATQSLLSEKRLEKRLAPINAVSGISECVGRAFKRARSKGQIILIEDLENP